MALFCPIRHVFVHLLSAPFIKSSVQIVLWHIYGRRNLKSSARAGAKTLRQPGASPHALRYCLVSLGNLSPFLTPLPSTLSPSLSFSLPFVVCDKLQNPKLINRAAHYTTECHWELRTELISNTLSRLGGGVADDLSCENKVNYYN